MLAYRYIKNNLKVNLKFTPKISYEKRKGIG